MGIFLSLYIFLYVFFYLKDLLLIQFDLIQKCLSDNQIGGLQMV